jgi:nicotinamide-nucleotide amidase
VAAAIASMLEAPRVLYHRRIRCFGVGESELEAMLPDLIHRGRDPRVGITVSTATITLRITASGDSRASARAATEPTVATIRECLGNLVFGEDDEELQDAVVRLLAAKGATLGTVEWGTAGLLAHWLGEAAANPEYSRGPVYSGGIVAVGDSVRERIIGATARGEVEMDGGRAKPQAMGDVPTNGGAANDAPTLVGELARGCKKLLSTNYVLATGPLPNYDPTGSVVPDFWYALAKPTGISVRTSPYAGNPHILKILSAKRALNWLRLELMKPS